VKPADHVGARDLLVSQFEEELGAGALESEGMGVRLVVSLLASDTK
jgi:hypothetical protein